MKQNKLNHGVIMKMNIEEIILKNIDTIDIFTELNDNNLEYHVKVKINSKDQRINKLFDLYLLYIEKKYKGDNIKLINNYLYKILKINKVIEIDKKEEKKNDLKMEELEVTFSNGKQLIINVPIQFRGHSSIAVENFLSKINYRKMKNDLEYRIYELFFDYYNYLDIDNLIIFDSNKLHVDIHAKKNVKNSGSLYFFSNGESNNNVVELVLEDYLNNNLKYIDGIKLNHTKLKCHFNNGKTLEVPVNIDIINKRLSEIENTFLDNNKMMLIKKKV